MGMWQQLFEAARLECRTTPKPGRIPSGDRPMDTSDEGAS